MVTWNTAWSSPFCTPVYNRAEIYTSIWDSEHSRGPFCQAIFHWNLLQNPPCGVKRARVESTIQVHAGLPQPAVIMVTERVVRWQSTTNGRQARQGFGEQLWVIGLQKEKEKKDNGWRIHWFQASLLHEDMKLSYGWQESKMPQIPHHSGQEMKNVTYSV